MVRRLMEFWIKHWQKDKPEVYKEPTKDAKHVREVVPVSDEAIENSVSPIMGKNLAMAWKAGARWMRRKKDGK